MAKILIIEDDQDVSFSLQSYLTIEKFHVEVASNGVEGLEKLQYYQYDVVILDWKLPDITGIEVLREFRSSGGKTPVLMLTGRQEAADKETGLDSGADDYLTKPFHAKELSARIRALLRRPPVFQSDTLRARDLVLDVKARKLTKDGREIPLAPMEFALLEFLMRYPNEVFTPEALLNRVWPSDSDASPTTIRTCIKKIRQKIEPDEVESMIKNLPGVGYRLDTD
jgi:DNA-binding response OmpR family regulator